VLLSGLSRDLDDTFSGAFVFDPTKRFYQRSPLSRFRQVPDLIGKPRLLLALSGSCSFEEVPDIYVQCIGELLQAACADAIYPLFVFLDLLKRNSGRLA